MPRLTWNVYTTIKFLLSVNILGRDAAPRDVARVMNIEAHKRQVASYLQRYRTLLSLIPDDQRLPIIVDTTFLGENSTVLEEDVKAMLSGRIAASVSPVVEESVKIIETKMVQEKAKKVQGKLMGGTRSAGTGTATGVMTGRPPMPEEAGNDGNHPHLERIRQGRRRVNGPIRGEGKGKGKGRRKASSGMLKLDEQMTNFDTGLEHPSDLSIFFGPPSREQVEADDQGIKETLKTTTIHNCSGETNVGRRKEQDDLCW